MEPTLAVAGLAVVVGVAALSRRFGIGAALGRAGCSTWRCPTCADGQPFDPRILDRARADNRLTGERRGPGPTGQNDPDLREQYLQLRLAMLAAERARLLDIRARGELSSQAVKQAQQDLDVIDARLQQLTDHPAA